MIRKLISEIKNSILIGSLTIINFLILFFILIFYKANSALLQKITLSTLILTLLAIIWYSLESRKMANSTKETLEFSKRLSKEAKDREQRKHVQERKDALHRLIIEIQLNRRKAIYIMKRKNYRFIKFENIYWSRFIFSSYSVEILKKDLSVVDNTCELYSAFEYANHLAQLMDKCETAFIYEPNISNQEKRDKINNILKEFTEGRIEKLIDKVIKKLEHISKQFLNI